MTELLKKLDAMGNEPEVKAGYVGVLSGLLGGIVFDVEYLSNPNSTFDAKIAKVRDGMKDVSHLSGDLGVVAPKQQKVVKNFIARDIHHKQAEVQKLAAHKPASPNFYVEGAAAVGSASFFGTAAVLICLEIKNYRQKHQQKHETAMSEYEAAEKAGQIVDNEFEMLESWLARKKPGEPEK